MELLKVAASLHGQNDEQKKFIVHETKYALLGAILFLIFIIPWTTSLVQNTFPLSRGPITIVYKLILFICIYYIIQKTSWFQNL
uniref:Uncharacterized protein n=1 Tax=viral metagenome TaxID=1070528 RepID=A0A6C0CGE2_9ZZZZ